MATGDPWCATHGFTPCRCHEFRGMAMSGNFTVLTPEQEERLRKLETFYSMIRQLANTSNLNQYPLIYQALSQVDPKWNEGSN